VAGRDINIRVEPNSQVNVAAAGSFVFVRAAGGPLDFETESGKLVTMISGDKLTEVAPGFDGFTVFNNTGTPILANLVVGFGDFDVSVTVGTISLTKSTTSAMPPDVTMVPGGGVLIALARVARREIFLSNLDLVSPVRIYVGGIAGPGGVILRPDQTIILTTTQDIYGFQSAVGAPTPAVIAVLELND